MQGKDGQKCPSILLKGYDMKAAINENAKHIEPRSNTIGWLSPATPLGTGYRGYLKTLTLDLELEFQPNPFGYSIFHEGQKCGTAKEVSDRLDKASMLIQLDDPMFGKALTIRAIPGRENRLHLHWQRD